MLAKRFFVRIAGILVAIFILFSFGHNYAQSIYISNLPTVEHAALLSKIVVLPDDQEYWEEAKEILKRVSELPESLLHSLKNNQIKLKLFTGSLTDQAEAAHLKGIQPRGYITKTWDDVPGMGGSKTVLVKVGYSEKGMDHNSINLELHELAHSIDQVLLNAVSQTRNFQEIWLKEVQILFPNQSYFIGYPEEYFAETFAMYYYNHESNAELLEKAPLTYELIRNLEHEGYT